MSLFFLGCGRWSKPKIGDTARWKKSSMESLIRRWLWCQENVGISTEMATETETFHKSHFVWNDHGDGTDDDDGDDDHDDDGDDDDDYDVCQTNGNLQGKYQTRRRPPRLNTGP